MLTGGEISSVEITSFCADVFTEVMYPTSRSGRTLGLTNGPAMSSTRSGMWSIKREVVYGLHEADK